MTTLAEMNLEMRLEQHVLAWLRQSSPERLEEQEAVAQITEVLVQRTNDRQGEL